MDGRVAAVAKDPEELWELLRFRLAGFASRSKILRIHLDKFQHKRFFFFANYNQSVSSEVRLKDKGEQNSSGEALATTLARRWGAAIVGGATEVSRKSFLVSFFSSLNEEMVSHTFG